MNKQFQTQSCVHYTIFSVVKVDLYIRAMLLDHILAWKKQAYASYLKCDNVTIILILQTMAFHILELRKLKFFVPVETRNRFLFLVL